LDYKSSELKATKVRHLARLKGRLEVLTENYAAFFEGFGPRRRSAHGQAMITVLTELQNLNRAQSARYGLAAALHEFDEESGTMAGAECFCENVLFDDLIPVDDLTPAS
jgi:hypothetical protein